jgi:hypothetical protein
MRLDSVYFLPKFIDIRLFFITCDVDIVHCNYVQGPGAEKPVAAPPAAVSQPAE